MTPAELRRIASSRTFVVPGWLALVSGGGLLVALVCDGAWDVVAWVAIGAPLAAIAWAWHTARH